MWHNVQPRVARYEAPCVCVSVLLVVLTNESGVLCGFGRQSRCMLRTHCLLLDMVAHSKPPTHTRLQSNTWWYWVVVSSIPSAPRMPLKGWPLPNPTNESTKLILLIPSELHHAITTMAIYVSATPRQLCNSNHRQSGLTQDHGEMCACARACVCVCVAARQQLASMLGSIATQRHAATAGARTH